MPSSDKSNEGGDQSDGTVVLFTAEDLTEYTTADENYWSVSSTGPQELTITGCRGRQFRVCYPSEWGQLDITSTDWSPSRLTIVAPEFARACHADHREWTFAKIISWHETASGNRLDSVTLEGDIWGFDVVFDEDESMFFTYQTLGRTDTFNASYV
ncbi:hypothetical protein BKA56DRAFT_619170 [Ilyonectria sp. MPI-CAGE-AT-0026]|nr:hypothetical protein BKA56DRAFT_619170 [Ilyonectria sp. MPI-CAGE-AT-0026]